MFGSKEETSAWMGYDSIEAMDRDHDSLHRDLANKFGVWSHSMRDAKGETLTEDEFWIACFEEEAVLYVQRWLVRIGVLDRSIDAK